MEQPASPHPGNGLVALPAGELFAVAAEYEQAGRLDDAARITGHILSAHPQQADTLHLAGVVAFRRGRYDEALLRMQQAVRHGADRPLYLRNLCEVYRKLGRLDEALAAGREARRLAPGDPLCLHNLAVIHYHRLELEQSMAAARQALALAPNLPGAHFALAEALLLRGEMAEGWDEYEWRFSIAGTVQPLPATDKPQWDGSDLEGTLLIVADQGLGDAIQFMRYIPWAAGRCRGLAIASSPELAALLPQVAPGVPVFHNWNECPAYDAHITLSGLPRLAGTRVGTIPWSGPYVRARDDRRNSWAARLTGMLPPGYARIGIVWAGRPTHSNDLQRSLPLQALRPLSSLPRTALVTLQKGGSAAQAADWFGRAPLLALGNDITDYDDTMAILDNLDLLVTVDTSVGHLAGAMGRPAWVMLPHAPDWRWLLDRDDTPWYPAHRLYRQSSNRTWLPVMERIARDLAGITATL